MKTKMKWSLLVVVSLVVVYLLTCTKDALFNKKDSKGTQCAAFVSKVAVSDSALDTTKLAIIDTVHTFDTLSLVGVIIPYSNKVTPTWSFGDSSGGGGTIVRHAYQHGGTFHAIFTIRDMVGGSMSDTVVVVVNTPPRVPILLQPDTASNQKISDRIFFNWSCGDADGDSLKYTLRLDTLAVPQKAYPSISKDTTYTLNQGQLLPEHTYYWNVKATDRFLDSGVSVTHFFVTAPATGSISGNVIGQGGVINNGFKVTLLRNGGQLATISTDSTGSFSLSNIKEGAVLVIFSDSGYFKPDTLLDTIVAGINKLIKSDTLKDTKPPVFTVTCPAKVRLNTDFHLQVSARDTFYRVDSILIDAGSGFHRLGTSDTILRILSAGILSVKLKAYDPNGNIGYDTVYIRGNALPNIPAIVSPKGFVDVPNSQITMTWTCTDPDDSVLHYDFIRAKSPAKTDSIIANNLSSTSYQWTAQTTDYGLYYWKIRAFDAFDTVISAVDSFRVSNGTGTIAGIVQHQKRTGTTGNDSIQIVAYKNLANIGKVKTAADGSYSFLAVKDTIQIVATDYGFAPETTSVVVVNGISTNAKTLVLLDTLAPIITKSADTVIRSGGSASIHIAARDTFYTVDSLFADFGSGAHQISLTKDTVVSYTAYGNHYIKIRAVDANGNVRKDSINVHVNKPPNIPSFVSPLPYADLSVGALARLTWSCSDTDNAQLHYDVFKVKSPAAFNMATPVSANKTDTFYTWTALVADTGIYYWKIRVFDGIDTVISAVDSFRISNGTGSISGIVQRQKKTGATGNDSITVKAIKNGSTKIAKTAADGSYTINQLSDSILVVATDYGFKPESVIVLVVNSVTKTVPTLILKDTLPPIITKSADTVIKSGGSANIHIAARDTFYTVDSLIAGFGSGMHQISLIKDTVVSYTVTGDHFIKIRAVDENGNVRKDSILVHVNYPPKTPVKDLPAVGAKILVGVAPTFRWSVSDTDNVKALHYDLYIGSSRSLTIADLVASNLHDTTYNLWSKDTSKTYFWKIVAYDGYDTSVSTIDSFNVGQYNVGKIYGYAKLAGVQRHNGIRVTIAGSTQTYIVPTDSMGYVAVTAVAGEYTVTAVDTLRNQFSVANCIVSVNAGDSTSFSLPLHDDSIPHISCSSPASGSIVRTRSFNVQGLFTDVGSQVNVDSVHATVNGVAVPLTSINRTSYVWNFNMTNVADGHYSVTLYAADSAKNSAVPLTRTFTVNAKTITAKLGFNHDTMSCTTSVANVNPPIRAYYWKYAKNASNIWNDSVLTTAQTLTQIHPLPDVPTIGPDTLIVMAVDDSGMTVLDTIPYVIALGAPKVSLGNDTILPLESGSWLTPLALHGNYTEKFGHAQYYDWSFDKGTTFSRTLKPDTAIQFPSKYNPGITCILRITDYRGQVGYDTMVVQIGKSWTSVGRLPTSAVTGDGIVSLAAWSDTCIYISFADATNKITVMRWNGTAWSTTGSGFTTGQVNYPQMVIPTAQITDGIGTGIGTYYPVPVVSYYDETKKKIYTYSPTGTVLGNLTAIKAAVSGGMRFRIVSSTNQPNPAAYIAYVDSITEKLKVQKLDTKYNTYDTVGSFVSGYATYDWQIDDFATNGITSYILYHQIGASGFVDSLSIYSGTAWQKKTIITSYVNPTLLDVAGDSLLMADGGIGSGVMGTGPLPLTVKILSGTSWTQVGATLTSNDIENLDGYLIGPALQKSDSYICVAYGESISGTDSLRVKAYDGVNWNSVGSNLPGGVRICKTGFCAKNGRMYVAYTNSSTNQITVLQLR